MNEFLLTSSMLEQSYMFNIFPFFWMVFILLSLSVQRIDLTIIISRPQAGRAFGSFERDIASILLVQRLDCLAGDMLKCIYMSTLTRLCAQTNVVKVLSRQALRRMYLHPYFKESLQTLQPCVQRFYSSLALAFSQISLNKLTQNKIFRKFSQHKIH